MRTMTEEQTCGTCLFCVRATGALNQGRCHYGPPTAVALPIKGSLGQPGIQQMGMYPPVELQHRGCGAYQKASKVEENSSSEDQ
jgi:hypothetical protein